MVIRWQARQRRMAPTLAAWWRGENGTSSVEAQCSQAVVKRIDSANTHVVAEGVAPELGLLDAAAQDQQARALLEREVRRLESVERLIVVATGGAGVRAASRFHGLKCPSLRAS
jgi:hypothetical protein